jgi:hypothetical protein
MSSRPLLTITESHGFRALMAAIISIIGAIRILGRGLRNLAYRKVQPAAAEAGPSFWARILSCRTASTRKVPVLWFDTSGGRASPLFGGLRPQPLPAYSDRFHFPAPSLAEQALAEQARTGGTGWDRYRA